MGFTGKLGTPFSKLGSSFKLGTGAAPGISLSLSIDAVASVHVNVNYVFTGQIGIGRSMPGFISPGYGAVRETTYNDSVTIASVASTVSFAAQVFEKQKELLGTSSIVLLPGIGYTPTLSIDCTASITETVALNNTYIVPIAGTASFNFTNQMVLVGNETVGAIASLVLSPEISYVLSLNVPGKGYIFVEGYYNILMVTAKGSITEAATEAAAGTETASGISSMGVSASVVFNRSISQTLLLTQVAHALPLPQHLTQTLAFTQTVHQGNVYNKSIVHTLSFTQDFHRTYPASNTLTITDSVSSIRVHNLHIVQTLGFTQSGTRKAVYGRHLTQTFTLTNGQGRTIVSPLISGPKGRRHTYIRVPARAVVVKG